MMLAYISWLSSDAIAQVATCESLANPEAAELHQRLLERIPAEGICLLSVLAQSGVREPVRAYIPLDMESMSQVDPRGTALRLMLGRRNALRIVPSSTSSDVLFVLEDVRRSAAVATTADDADFKPGGLTARLELPRAGREPIDVDICVVQLLPGDTSHYLPLRNQGR